MSSQLTALRPSPTAPRGARSRWPVLAATLVVVPLGLGLGVGLARIGDAFGPVAVLVLPLVLAALWTALTRPALAPLLVVLTVPVGFVAVPVAGLQLIEVSVLAAGGLVVLTRLLDGRTPVRWPRMAWWPTVIIAFAAVAATTAADLGLATKQVALLAGGMLLLLTTVSSLRADDDLYRMVGVLAVVGAALSVHGLGGAGDLQATAGALTVANRPTGIFTSPNQLGAVAGITVLLGAGLAVGARSSWERGLGVGSALAGAGGLVVTLSRGAWFGTGVALVAFVLAVPAARRTSMRWAAPAAMAVAIVGAFVLPQGPTQVQVIQDRFESLAQAETSPYDNRTTIWAEAMRQIVASPVVGQGPANFPVASRRAVSEASFVGAHHAHNSVLNIAAEFGLVGLALVAGFTLALGRVLVRALRRRAGTRERALVAGIGAALLVQVAHGLVDYTLRNAVLAMITWLLAGMILAADDA